MSTCAHEGKIIYENRGEAQRAAGSYRRGKRPNVYPCKACGGFHLTSAEILPSHVARRRAGVYR